MPEQQAAPQSEPESQSWRQNSTQPVSCQSSELPGNCLPLPEGKAAELTRHILAQRAVVFERLADS